jgi:hypothetical protein
MRTEFGSRRMHGVYSVGRGLLGVSERLRRKSTTARLSLEPPASNRLAGLRAQILLFIFSSKQVQIWRCAALLLQFLYAVRLSTSSPFHFAPLNE